MFQLANWHRLTLGLSVCLSASTCSAAETKAGVAEGFPVVLRGPIIGTPVVADLDGDGKMEVVASAMQSVNNRNLRSLNPTIAVQLWALKSDGQSFPNWPLTVKTVEERQAMYDDKGFRPWADNWYASPSVWDVDGDGADDIVLNAAGHGTTDERGNVMVLYADGGRFPLAHGGSDWASPAIADIDGDGIPDLVLDHILTNVSGKPVMGFPFEKRPQSGYQPAIGDVDNDGQPEILMPSSGQDISLLRNNGEVMPGWPRKVGGYSTYVVMGDVTGDDKKELITVDFGGSLRVWNVDGTSVELAPDIKQSLMMGDGVMAREMVGYSPPCLADLDGDGKAEILMMGNYGKSVYAFHGDGRPLLNKPRGEDEPWPKIGVPSADGKETRWLDPKVPGDRETLEIFAARERRGRIATLPAGNADSHAGITVVDLGSDGVMDIFAGTQWIRLAKGGSTQITEMVPPEAETDKPLSFSNNGSCSVVDIDGDGLAEVLFGLRDGRLFVYRTGMSLKARDAQWPTLSGNFQHTGVWTRAQ